MGPEVEETCGTFEASALFIVIPVPFLGMDGNEEVRGTFAVFVSLQKFTVSKQSCIKEKSPKGGKVKNRKKVII